MAAMSFINWAVGGESDEFADVGSGKGVVMCILTTATGVEALKGGAPQTMWYRVMPRE